MKKNISFYVATNRKDKRGLAPVYGQVTIKSKNYPFQIEKVKPRYWNSNKQRVNKSRENEPDNRYEEINKLIDSLSSDLDRFSRFDNYESQPPRDEVKKIFFEIVPKGKSFNVAYEEFIESNRNKVAYNTTRNRNTAKNFIKRYEDYRGIEIQFEDISLEFFESLFDYACDFEEIEDNTFATYIAKFKAFLDWAIKKGYFDKEVHKRYTFAEKEKPVIHLTVEEFQTLYKKTLKDKKLDKARDLYCFGCLTGLRFSDIASLRYEHFQGSFIYKNIKKTKAEDGIPLLPKAKAIIDKYRIDGSIYPLPQLSNVKLNKNIKLACRKAKINTITKKLEYRKNEPIESFHKKHKLITVHTARKTFITIGFMLGMDVKTIKSITGHKKDSTFDKYLKIANEYKKEKMFDAWKNV